VTAEARSAVSLPVRATVLRVVETQYTAATMRLVDSADAQAVLEDAIETSKPPVPPGFAHLHYLLYTPFRYPPSPWPSRFRGPADPGVFYAAERPRTALAEVAHWRLKVLLDAVDLQALEPAAHTVFSVGIEATLADAATLRPATRRDAVLHPDDYGPAQAWAREVRAAGRQAIRYPSVRDRPDGVCWAVFAPEAFRSKPKLAGNWLIRVTRDGAHCRTTSAPFQTFAFSSPQLLATC
jgi:hypothetical protein